MRAICRIYAAKTKKMLNEENWALAGLLHDADYELTRSTPEKHTLYLEEKIGSILPKEVMYAIKAHNYRFTGVPPQSSIDWALYTCDELTGFVISTVLSQREKHINTITADMVMAKMQDASFAKDVDRAQIVICEEKLGFPIREYTGIVLSAMQTIANSLGFEA
jgi:predicted hydrolase (HD superfamily)